MLHQVVRQRKLIGTVPGSLLAKALARARLVKTASTANIVRKMVALVAFVSNLNDHSVAIKTGFSEISISIVPPIPFRVCLVGVSPSSFNVYLVTFPTGTFKE